MELVNDKFIVAKSVINWLVFDSVIDYLVTKLATSHNQLIDILFGD